MSKHAAFYIAIFATLAIFIGWHFALFRGASSELATRVRQVPRLRDERDRRFGTVTLLAVLFAVVLYVIATRGSRHG
ncbi:MAG TPA: hypothetical protein VMU94_27835 [Streptosporangiaceae bacterium]|nr:hypothetical protein [Streptosporangiaceae bacterium]